MEKEIAGRKTKDVKRTAHDVGKIERRSGGRSAGQSVLARGRYGGRIRLLAALLPATGITLGLFALMNAMVTVKEIDLTAKMVRTLVAITPQLVDTAAVRSVRTPPQRLEYAPKPPPPPKASATRAQIDLPQPKILGAAPETLAMGRLQTIAVPPAAIPDRDARPIRKPDPVYPPKMLARGMEGVCEVRFDVNPRGRPYNIVADCSDAGFKRAAERAVSQVEFAPKIVRGKPAMRRNVVYPLEFKIN